jgi:hypothetical protein
MAKEKPQVVPTNSAPPAPNRPNDEAIEEANRETLPKGPNGELVDPKQEEVEGSAS